MGEQDLVRGTDRPRTRGELAGDLRRLGVRSGDVVVVHSSLSALGWVSGGAVAVVQALQDAVTDVGTLVVPTHTSGLTDPAHWSNPPVPADWVPLIRESVPAFDPSVFASQRMGAIAETLRIWPGTLRSSHPHVSFAAWGRHAERVTTGHALSCSLGDDSPLGRTLELGAKVLLLGTRRCTTLHLAETRAGVSPTITQGAALLVGGERQWVSFDDIDHDDTHFDQVLTEFCTLQGISPGRVGSAETLLLDQHALVDFATVRLAELVSAAGP